MEGHTTGGIPRWSPTLVLVARFSAYVWQSGRDAQFSLTYGRMYYFPLIWHLSSFNRIPWVSKWMGWPWPSDKPTYRMRSAVFTLDLKLDQVKWLFF